MKIAAQENLVPGNSFLEKVENLAAFGYDGVELSGNNLAGRVQEVKSALKNSSIKPAAICGGFSFNFLSQKQDEREQSKKEFKDLLAAAAEVGSQGVIIVPIFGQPQLPDMTPWKTAVELEEELWIEQLRELTEYAGQQGSQIILEPLNRYETHYLKTLAHAVQLCEKVQSKHMTILGDFFHMNIEEANIANSFKEAAKWLGYVHLADSNRVVPGLGHTNFKEGFAALQEIGYTGFMSLECGVPGDRAQTLKQSVKFLKSQL